MRHRELFGREYRVTDDISRNLVLSFASSVTHCDRLPRTLAVALGGADSPVIPADAGIQAFRGSLDPGFRRGDGANIRNRICEEEYLEKAVSLPVGSKARQVIRLDHPDLRCCLEGLT